MKKRVFYFYLKNAMYLVEIISESKFYHSLKCSWPFSLSWCSLINFISKLCSYSCQHYNYNPWPFFHQAPSSLASKLHCSCPGSWKAIKKKMITDDINQQLPPFILLAGGEFNTPLPRIGSKTLKIPQNFVTYPIFIWPIW